jgi:hypothetical protein
VLDLAPTDPLLSGFILVVVGLTAITAIVLVALSRDPSPFLAWMVGATAGFDFLQVAHVHAFAFACGLFLLFAARRQEPLKLGAVSWLGASALLLAATSQVGSLVNSQTLALQLIAMAAAASIVALGTDQASRERMLKGLLAVCTFGALVAVGQRSGLVPYTPFHDSAGITRVKGIYHEPDWLGLFSAIGLVIAFRLRVRHLWLVAAILSFGLFLSLARAAWLALSVAVVVGYAARLWTQRDQEIIARNRKTIAVLGVLATLLVAADGGLRSNIESRIDGATSQQIDVSVAARHQQQASLRHLIDMAPWYGLGLSAAGRVQVSGEIQSDGRSRNNVASNWILGWLVDAKYLALPMIGLLLTLALRNAARLTGPLLGLVLINSLFSNAIMLPIAWLAVGLAIAELPSCPRAVSGGWKVATSPVEPARTARSSRGSSGPRTATTW